MPTTTDHNEDPVVASYEVCIAAGGVSTPSSVTPAPRLVLLQYPAHRPQTKPYSAARHQKPKALRLKPETGLLEVDIPILTHEHYNIDNGFRYRKVLDENKTTHGKTTYGLAAGFSTGHAGTIPQTTEVQDVPPHHEPDTVGNGLDTQTLGGKVNVNTVRDPVYMIGTFRDNRIHLSHLDALVQVRPQLHHVDAEDEMNQGRTTVALSKAKAELGPPKLETRAVELKLKDNKDEAKDRSLNTNARLLRSIQHEPWRVYSWADQDDAESRTKFNEHMYLHEDSNDDVNQLKSAIGNSEWLDKMSAPREAGHGKKGLLAKLRGRERERLRRKKNEEERKRMAHESAGASGPLTNKNSFLDHGSESSELSDPSSSDSDVRDASKDIDMVDLMVDEDIEIKEEPSTVAAASTTIPPLSATLEVTSPSDARLGTRKRGRPLQATKASDPIAIDD